MKRLVTIYLVFASVVVFAQPWTVNVQEFEFTMNITGRVKISGEFYNNSETYIGAFLGDDCRGVAEVLFDESNGYLYYLTIYANQVSGEELSFKLFDHNEQIVDLPDEVIFVNDAVYGSADYPFEWMSPAEYSRTDFLSFSSSYQTAPAEINLSTHSIALEINPSGNLLALIVDFEVPAGAEVMIGQTIQESGVTENDFTQTQNYSVAGTDGTAQNWTVTITQATPVEQFSADMFSVYPNPCKETLVISTGDNTVNSVSIVDVTGQVQQTHQVFAGEDIELSLSNLTRGQYFVQIHTSKGIFMRKVVKD